MRQVAFVSWAGWVAALSVAAALAGCSDDSSSGGAGGSGGSGGEGSVEPGPLTIATDKGEVAGKAVDATRLFLGIPYASPPVGDDRWRAPRAHDPWTGKLDATQKGPNCAQSGVLSGEYDDNTVEDCLTLNIWTPNDASAANLPVLFWVHGGGFVLGSGSDQAYDGKVLSEATNSVVVTINYRLGAFGFLALAELEAEDPGHPSTGTYGIEDQRAALQWVKTNISAFGGDPARVTLFGESAGGISTCFHLVSPASEGLFQRAIIESGPCDRSSTRESGLAQGVELVAALGCDGEEDVLACLRAKPPADIANALGSSNDFLFGDGANWFPIEDGLNIPGHPPDLLSSGAFADVPVLLGTNADEATLFFVLADENQVETEEEFEVLANELVPGHGGEIVAQYPASRWGTAQKAVEAAVGDAGFICPTRRTARAITANGGSAWLYHFTHAPENTLLSGLGAFHSAEVRYVFGNPAQLIPQPLTEDELKLASNMMGYWSRFGAAGDPNGDGVEWPRYTSSSDEHLVLAFAIEPASGLKTDACDFWDNLSAKQ